MREKFDPTLTYPNPSVKPYDPYRPNHYYEDSAGDPLTCTANHNHPGDIFTDANTCDQYQPVLRDGKFSSWDPIPKPPERENTVNTDKCKADEVSPIAAQIRRIDELLDRTGYSLDRLIGKIEPILTYKSDSVEGSIAMLDTNEENSSLLNTLVMFERRIASFESDLDRVTAQVQL